MMALLIVAFVLGAVVVWVVIETRKLVATWLENEYQRGLKDGAAAALTALHPLHSPCRIMRIDELIGTRFVDVEDKC